jgi:hypothetical protein
MDPDPGGPQHTDPDPQQWLLLKIPVIFAKISLVRHQELFAKMTKGVFFQPK